MAGEHNNQYSVLSRSAQSSRLCRAKVASDFLVLRCIALLCSAVQCSAVQCSAVHCAVVGNRTYATSECTAYDRPCVHNIHSNCIRASHSTSAVASSLLCTECSALQKRMLSASHRARRRVRAKLRRLCVAFPHAKVLSAHAAYSQYYTHLRRVVL